MIFTTEAILRCISDLIPVLLEVAVRATQELSIVLTGIKYDKAVVD